jgi:hypothetical protein
VNCRFFEGRVSLLAINGVILHILLVTQKDGCSPIPGLKLFLEAAILPKTITNTKKHDNFISSPEQIKRK